MKTAIICISDPYMYRGELLKTYYESKGEDVVILTPDFSHRRKEKITSVPAGVHLIGHPPYKKNLSAARLWGHYRFAWKCRDFLESWNPDRIHCLVPANSLCQAMDSYKKEHPQVQLYFDINDLWPESLPSALLKKLPLYGVWRRLRDEHLKAADKVFIECDFYREILGQYNSLSWQTLYWARRETPKPGNIRWDEQTVHMAYLGSMNNIVDIDAIGKLVKALVKQKPVIIHLIGSGERKKEMTETILAAGGLIEDHGELFDQEKKQAVFDGCRFGINIMRPEVRVGLSMKSLDYLCAGLPLINTLPGDTAALLLKNDAGWNMKHGDWESMASRIARQTRQENEKQRRNAMALYEECFTYRSFCKTLDQSFAPELFNENKRRKL